MNSRISPLVWRLVFAAALVAVFLATRLAPAIAAASMSSPMRLPTCLKADSWIFAKGRYTHDPATGARVAQYDEIDPSNPCPINAWSPAVIAALAAYCVVPTVRPTPITESQLWQRPRGHRRRVGTVPRRLAGVNGIRRRLWWWLWLSWLRLRCLRWWLRRWRLWTRLRSGFWWQSRQWPRLWSPPALGCHRPELRLRLGRTRSTKARS